MIGVVLKGHDFKYEVSELIKLFTSDFRFIDERDCMMVVENTVFFHNNNVFSKTMYYFSKNICFSIFIFLCFLVLSSFVFFSVISFMIVS